MRTQTFSLIFPQPRHRNPVAEQWKESSERPFLENKQYHRFSGQRGLRPMPADQTEGNVMTSVPIKLGAALAALLMLWGSLPGNAAALSTAFAYQGRLMEGVGPANGA